MIFGNDRNELRTMYVNAWNKALTKQILSPLESQIVQVIKDHPEYQDKITFEFINKEFQPEEGKINPFLHMGLHLAVRKQVATNRPTGISSAFKGLLAKTNNKHEAEHLAVECLAEILWDAQVNNKLPDEKLYLKNLLAI